MGVVRSLERDADRVLSGFFDAESGGFESRVGKQRMRRELAAL